MDLTGFTDPYVLYSRWFYNEFGPYEIDDTLKILVSNGVTTVEIDKVGKDPSTFFQWVQKSIRLQDFIPITTTMQFFFRTHDFDPDANITEAGLDRFMVIEAADLGLEEIKEVLVLYPNPVSDKLFVKELKENTNYVLLDLNGKIVMEGQLTVLNPSIEMFLINNGIYFLRFDKHVYKVVKKE